MIPNRRRDPSGRAAGRRPPFAQASLVLLATSCLVARPAVLPAAPGDGPASAAVAAPAPGPASPTVRVVADPSVELMSIVCYLAGFEEYGKGQVARWTAAVDSQFAPWRGHRALDLARRLREERGISYDAPMSLAICLTTNLPAGAGAAPAGLGTAAASAAGSSAAQPSSPGPFTLTPRLPLDPLPASFDERWTAADARDFVQAVQDFARAADFTGFWARQAPLRETAVARLAETVRDHDPTGWFAGFFGARPGADFVLAIGLLNGGGSYGPRVSLPDGREEIWSILGVWKVDEQGLPAFDPRVLFTVVHEFCHSYANPIVDAHLSELAPATEAIFPHVRAQMEAQAYGSGRIVLCESVVRAACARWAHAAYGPAALQKSVEREIASGFLWAGELTALLGEYESARDRYPTFDTFMPRVVALFDNWAPRVAGEVAKRDEERCRRLEELRAKGPKIAAMNPTDGAGDVDPALPAIVIAFDRAMKPDHLAVMATDAGPIPPLDGQVSFDSTRTTLTIPVKLAPGTTYAFGLNSEAYLVMQDNAGNPLPPVVVTFTTRP